MWEAWLHTLYARLVPVWYSVRVLNSGSVLIFAMENDWRKENPLKLARICTSASELYTNVILTARPHVRASAVVIRLYWSGLTARFATTGPVWSRLLVSSHCESSQPVSQLAGWLKNWPGCKSGCYIRRCIHSIHNYMYSTCTYTCVACCMGRSKTLPVACHPRAQSHTGVRTICIHVFILCSFFLIALWLSNHAVYCRPHCGLEIASEAEMLHVRMTGHCYTNQSVVW